MEFIPFNKETKSLVVEEKKTFVLSAKNIGDVLDLNTTSPYDSKEDADGVYTQYQAKEEDPVRVFRMNKLEKRNFNFSYCEI